MVYVYGLVMKNPGESNHDRKVREFAQEVFDSGETCSGSFELTEEEAREDRWAQFRSRDLEMAAADRSRQPRPVNRLCFTGQPGCNCRAVAWALGITVLASVGYALWGHFS